LLSPLDPPYTLAPGLMEEHMSMYTVALLVLPVLFAFLYILFRSGAPQAPTLGHHLLASGSALHQVRRG
jgi:hypothetical protein